MDLKDQVWSIEQAQRLKGLAVKQDSYWFYVQFRNESSPPEQWGTIHSVIDDDLSYYEDRDYLKDVKIFAAFSVAELGLLLPDDCRTYRLDTCWQSYYPSEGMMQSHLPYADNLHTEARAKADLLIFLLKNGYCIVKR